MMPKMSGFDMVKAIRQNDKDTPVLFLTAKTSVDDVVRGFDLGGNDYLKKPFAIPELVVRMKALLGREPKTKDSPSTYPIGDFLFTPETAILQNRTTGESTILPRREADILHRLCQHQGEIVPTRSLQVLITRLRHHLSRDPHIHILNLRGQGYKLISE